MSPISPSFFESKSFFVLAATVLMTLQPFLTTMTKVDGAYQYLQVSTTLLAELLKLVLSVVMYVLQPKEKQTHARLRPHDVLPFATPAAIYFVNNNLIFVILMHVNSTTYQILSSLKTVFTGVLFRVILKRKLTDVQVVAVVLLACGSATSQLPSASCSSAPSSSVFGVSLALLACLLSAFGGVYSERLLRKDGEQHTIHLQNALLYAWGVAFNGLALFGKDSAAIVELGLLHGYTLRVWLLVCNNAFNGLAISAILKFSGNIVRVFAHAAAMLLTMLLELCFLGASPSPQLVLSISVVACATYLYNRPQLAAAATAAAAAAAADPPSATRLGGVGAWARGRMSSGREDERLLGELDQRGFCGAAREEPDLRCLKPTTTNPPQR